VLDGDEDDRDNDDDKDDNDPLSVEAPMLLLT
jgi:hypothetical protein